jgi:hypothetical protein
MVVADLEAAAQEMDARYGLASVEGGRHAGWGTANRIVPLGTVYLELVTVVDEVEAAGSAFGRWVSGARPADGAIRPFGWAVRTGELDAICARLGLTATSGSRRGHDGRPLAWRVAGLEESTADPSLPFFLEWAPGAALPGSAPATHRGGMCSIAGVHVTGDADRLARWLGGQDLPVTVEPGPPGVTAVVLSSGAGELAIPAAAS